MEEEDRLLWERAFKKFDDTDASIKELCKTTAEVKNKVDSHLEAQEKKAVKKEKVFYVIIAVIGGLYATADFIRELI